MGKIKKMKINSTLCKECGKFLGGYIGAPAKCTGCAIIENDELVKKVSAARSGWISRKNKHEGLGYTYELSSSENEQAVGSHVNHAASTRRSALQSIS